MAEDLDLADRPPDEAIHWRLAVAVAVGAAVFLILVYLVARAGANSATASPVAQETQTAYCMHCGNPTDPAAKFCSTVPTLTQAIR